jgi:phi LC3 family holin
MNFKNKIKNYGFWTSLTAAVILLMQTLGKNFSFVVDDKAIINTVNSVLGVFIVLGIISNPTSGTGYSDKLVKTQKKDK